MRLFLVQKKFLAQQATLFISNRTLHGQKFQTDPLLPEWIFDKTCIAGKFLICVGGASFVSYKLYEIRGYFKRSVDDFFKPKKSATLPTPVQSNHTGPLMQPEIGSEKPSETQKELETETKVMSKGFFFPFF